MQIQEEIAAKAKDIETIIKSYLPKEEGPQSEVIAAMNYSILAGGKRLRPMLMQETYRLFGGKGHIVEPFMAAMEMIHTYSLVHDDLPAMDNDEYRRGRKTTHVVYGEAMAILAGDGLLNYAFETALQAFSRCQVDQVDVVERYKAVASALSVLATKAGIYGMIGGQTGDILAENSDTPLDSQGILFIHEHKTAALIQASMMIGAILAGASPEWVERMETCGYDIGVAFQIQDDILDVIGDEKVLGKPIGSDAKNQKQTFVTMQGLEASKEEVERLSKEALEMLAYPGGDASFLQALILQLIHRER